MDKIYGRILAVDPGEKHLGLAVSDPTQTIASPLEVIQHQSRTQDAKLILKIASEQGAVKIIVGHALDDLGQESPQGRKSARLADQIRRQGSLPVVLWDEYGSTRAAQAARREMGVPRKKRSGHLDELAATIILQSYLDYQPSREEK